MQYMLGITADEKAPRPGPGEPGFDEMTQAWADYGRALVAAGVLIDAASLAPSDLTTTVRLALGTDPQIMDGPYIEAKEQFGGYYRIEVPDLDAALDWAKRVPIPFAAIEVRPVAMAPAADGTPTFVGH